MGVNKIDKRLIAALGGGKQIARVRVHQKEVPSYRFVDFYRAAEAWARAEGGGETVLSAHGVEDLSDILKKPSTVWGQRNIREPAYLPWPVGVSEQEHLPIEAYWLLPATGSRPSPLVLRLRLMNPVSRLEVAGADEALVDQAVRSIADHSVEHSIYRGQLLEVGYGSEVHDEWGDPVGGYQLKVQFKSFDTPADEEFVVDEAVREALHRNVVDLFERRRIMKKLGVPLRRGVLLYGPPGTGKTYACRYVCGKLTDVTRIVVAGSALFHVDSAFALARMLQPALIILEDVDLVFQDRDSSPHGSLIGDLLDHMDGLRPFEDISFILTTNAIERLEAAIRERPGRISQLIRFGPPNEALRHRYLERYLKRYHPWELDLDALVRMSAGTTQAFLKEWVHRAVQIASERIQGPHDELALEVADFEAAMAEMTRFTEGSAGRIVGFHDAR